MARQRDEQKRQLIIETATRLFSGKGFHATSIQDIVSDSGLSVGTIYLYFSNKEEIFDALLENGLDAFTIELFKDISAEMPPEEIAEKLVTTILDVIYKNIKVVTILTNELGFQKKLQGFYSRIAEIISQKYIGNNDEESLYKMMNLSKKEFYALVTIIISGISNAMRLASGSKGGLMRMQDIKMIMNEIVLKSLLDRMLK